MKQQYLFFSTLILALGGLFQPFSILHSHFTPAEGTIPGLENPMSTEYLKANLRKKGPRLVLTSELEKELKAKIQNDPVVKNMYQAIRLNTQAILKEPLLKRDKVGRRLLGVSREMLYRVNMLGMSHRLEKDPVLLNRLNEEILAVCNFTDWNPSHYLDVAEMSLAIALAIDWNGADLPKTTVILAKNALIEKGIKPSYNKEGNVFWINGNNNWNQVCHGGMIAAAIAIAEQDPELAVNTLHRALEGMPNALKEYGPDGIYPEGPTYWDYGTGYSVITSAMLESAFGTDFGLSNYPAFLESATCQVLCTAPSDYYYNFADCGDKKGKNGDLTLAWFAFKTGNKAFFEKERFLQPIEKMGKLARMDGAGLVWLSQFKEKTNATLPEAWSGGGSSPLVVFKSAPNDPHQYYFAGKGGRGNVSHGNMDAGSFVFELNGVRWVLDSGNQNYNDLEKIGFNLWGMCQQCPRWTLLTKNNFGHSTLSVNDSLFKVGALASIEGFKPGSNPEATIDLGPVFGNNLKSSKRRFVKDGPKSLLIEDQIETNANTKTVTWQLMTTADVELVKGGAIFKQEGKMLKIENLSHPNVGFSVVSLDPAPLEFDRQIPGLKRIELRFPAYLLKEGVHKIAVRLLGS
jgi:Heparinase II/III-like protein